MWFVGVGTIDLVLGSAFSIVVSPGRGCRSARCEVSSDGVKCHMSRLDVLRDAETRSAVFLAGMLSR